MPHKAPTHKPARIKPRDDRPSPSRRGYDGTWQKLRAWKLARDPLCEDCKREGRAVAATEVDHVNAIEDGGERLDPNNLRSQCKSHHSRKTVLCDGGFGRKRRTAMLGQQGEQRGNG